MANIEPRCQFRGIYVLVLAKALFLAAVVVLPANTAPVADVRNTKHNLSVTGPGTVKATSETQVCVFCHTPHGATQNAVPLWNRSLGAGPYTSYSSTSLDAIAIQGGALDVPGGSSKLCLSCHDGTLAIGNVNVLNGMGSTPPGNVAIAMNGTGAGGTMPDGSGASTGFTRKLGIDLTNDHPISLNYTNALATRDGELRVVDANQKYPAGTGTTIGVRAAGFKPALPLEPTGPGGIGQVQCGTCHDPHLKETDPAKGNQKFLRQNRFQVGQASDTLVTATDQICVNCHDKNKGFGSWAYSAHANYQVATQTYTATAATQREFPAGIAVWQAGCLNCHDTHTVQGARRLLREGTDSATTPKGGGSAALEETCYQCHSSTSIVTPTTTVPDIKTDFTSAGNRHMPITSTEQLAGTEVHAIGGSANDGVDANCTTANNQCGSDFIESRAMLGGISALNANNRHAECTDCHNPHRVVKFRSFLGNPPGNISGAPDGAGTHTHTDTNMLHTNIASGVLRGTWGVEPQYSAASASFQDLPTGYTVKRGDPGDSNSSAVGEPFVTREYQVCLKCHSDYGYEDDNIYPSGLTRPSLRAPGTPPNVSNRVVNSYTRYTNQAKEFRAPGGHQGSPASTTDSGSGASWQANNHRSWHPVMDATGRNAAARGGLSANNWRLPWRNIGSQTMYCTDCHGSNVTSNTSVIPGTGDNGPPWGPHGSSNNFILKGTWNTTSGGDQATTLCFKCHDANVYAPTSGGGTRTGFWIGPTSSRGSDKDGHYIHSQRDKIGVGPYCNWCHIAVPHGWKNKALLVNLNDVGPEAGQPAGTAVAVGYSNGPYYRNARLKVKNFRPSGNWVIDACGVPAQDSRNWMQNTCTSSPP